MHLRGDRRLPRGPSTGPLLGARGQRGAELRMVRLHARDNLGVLVFLPGFGGGRLPRWRGLWRNAGPTAARWRGAGGEDALDALDRGAVRLVPGEERGDVLGGDPGQAAVEELAAVGPGPGGAREGKGVLGADALGVAGRRDDVGVVADARGVEEGAAEGVGLLGGDDPAEEDVGVEATARTGGGDERVEAPREAGGVEGLQPLVNGEGPVLVVEVEAQVRRAVTAEGVAPNEGAVQQVGAEGDVAGDAGGAVPASAQSGALGAPERRGQGAVEEAEHRPQDVLVHGSVLDHPEEAVAWGVGSRLKCSSRPLERVGPLG